MSDKAAFTPVLERAFRHALDHLENIGDRPVGASTDLAQLRARFNRPLPEADVERATYAARQTLGNLAS